MQKNKEEVNIMEAFDERGAQIMAELNQRHNEYAALREQEEELRQQIRNLQSVIHDLKTESKFKISDILMPFGKGFVQLRQGNKNDFIKSHYEALNTLEAQLKGVIVQREHRGDEFGAAMLRAERYMWVQLCGKYGYTDEELYQQVHPVNVDVQPKQELEKMLDEIEVAAD